MNPATLKPMVAIPGATRIDLYRQTETDEDQTSDVPLSPVGVDLGDGIFLDTNGNLGVLVAEALGDDWATVKDFSVVNIRSSGLASDLEVRTEGKQTRVDDKGWFATDVDITQDGDITILKPDAWGSSPTLVTRTGDRIQVDNTAWLEKDFTITREGGKIKVEGDGFGPNYVISKGDGRLTIENTGFLGEDFTAEKNADGDIRGSGNSWLGLEFAIDRDEQVVRVTEGPLRDDYVIRLEENGASVDNLSWLAADHELSWRRA